MSFYQPDRITARTFIEFVEYHATLGSTNTLAADLRNELQPRTPALVLADEQTTGRGRGSNAWWSTAGAVTCSVVLDADRHGPPAESRPLAALASGLAVRALVADLLPGQNVHTKWPNDVLVGDQKVCGILSEQHSTDHGSVLIVGIGLNVNNSMAGAPDDVRQRATSIFDLTGQSLDLTDTLIQMLDHLSGVLEQLRISPVTIARQASQFNRLTGCTVTVDAPGETVTGQCTGIADDGALLLNVDGAIHRICAGTITDFS